MNKKGIIVSCFILVVIVLLNLDNSNKVDWRPTFNENETNPLDTKVFYEQLSFWFKSKSNKKVHTTFYEYDQYLRMQPVDSVKNYVNVSDEYIIDRTSFESLLDYVGYGNEAFISSNSFPYFVKDTLGFDIEYELTSARAESKKLSLNFAKDTLRYTSKIPYGASFMKDSTEAKKLGYYTTDEEMKELIL